MRVLILAPHTDDGELGCGGAIAKLVEENNDVYYAAFSLCEASIPCGLPKDILEVEVRAATRLLGIDQDKVLLYRYLVRHFSESRQGILQDLIDIRGDIRPDLIFVPSTNDVHQDHQVVTAEGIRAFKQSSILGYEMVWNNITFTTTSFMKLERRHLERKVSALACYTSQQAIRAYMNREFVESLARIRGVQVGAEFAESFEVVRWII